MTDHSSDIDIGVGHRTGTACRPANLVECLLNLDFKFIQAAQNFRVSIFQSAKKFFGSSRFFRQVDTCCGDTGWSRPPNWHQEQEYNRPQRTVENRRDGRPKRPFSLEETGFSEDVKRDSTDSYVDYAGPKNQVLGSFARRMGEFTERAKICGLRWTMGTKGHYNTGSPPEWLSGKTINLSVTNTGLRSKCG